MLEFSRDARPADGLADAVGGMCVTEGFLVHAVHEPGLPLDADGELTVLPLHAELTFAAGSFDDRGLKRSWWQRMGAASGEEQRDDQWNESRRSFHVVDAGTIRVLVRFCNHKRKCHKRKCGRLNRKGRRENFQTDATLSEWNMAREFARLMLMSSARTRLWSLSAFALPAILAGTQPGLAAEARGGPDQVREDFARDPGWTIDNLRQPPASWPTRRQDFGWSEATFPGAATPGMVGGWLERSTTPARFSFPIPERTLNNHLHAAGLFRVPRALGNSGALFGWFNDTSRGWRTPKSLVFRVDGNGPRLWVFFEYGTQRRLTGGMGCFEGEAYQTTPTEPFRADGSAHRWSLDYDPAGAAGNGLITFTLDGRPWKLPLEAGHKADGAVFNRFGLFNQELTGEGLEVWFADLEIDGQRLDLRREPGWEGRGNRTNFTDRVLRPFNDAGWRNSARAGGQAGELGGLIWRDEPPWFLARGVGQLSLDQELSAAGRIVMTGAAVDSAVYLGWFEADAKTNRAPARYRAPARNQLALLLEGPSRAGHYLRPVCADRTGTNFRQDSGPVILPDGTPHTWSLDYRPGGAGGHGEITWRVDDQQQTVSLPAGLREHGAAFDHFGFFNFQPDGAWLEVYVDDLRFSAGP